MKKVRSMVLGFLFALSLLLPGPAQAQDLKLRGEFEGGKLYQAGKFWVVELHGNYRQMGRQYGKLMRNQLQEFYQASINDLFIKKYGLKYEDMKEAAHSIFDLYPERFKAIVYGMAETSGMDQDKLIILDSFVPLVMFEGLPYCTGMAAWGDYTNGEPLVFGRNFDFGPLVKDFGRFLTLVIFNPNDGSVPTASFGYVGGIAINNGMNKAGLFIENNEGVISGGRIYYDNRKIVQLMELAFLLDSSTLQQMDTALHSYRTVCPIILNVASKNVAYSYECATFDTKRRPAVNDGLLVATNHFVDPSWGIALPATEPEDKTLTRRKNLLAQGEKHQGKFNAKTMMEVFDTTIPQGGPTWPLETHHTTYQIVAVPEQLKLWLKAPGYADWTEVDLEELFD